MAEDQNSASAVSQDAQRQVRVQLTSKQEEIALPENTGPILVPTGKSSDLITRHRLTFTPKACDDMRCQHW